MTYENVKPWSDMSEAELIAYAESIGFAPDWLDDGESFLGIAIWVAPDGEQHTLATLRDAVATFLGQEVET